MIACEHQWVPSRHRFTLTPAGMAAAVKEQFLLEVWCPNCDATRKSKV